MGGGGWKYVVSTSPRWSLLEQLLYLFSKCSIVMYSCSALDGRQYTRRPATLPNKRPCDHWEMCLLYRGLWWVKMRVHLLCNSSTGTYVYLHTYTWILPYNVVLHLWSKLKDACMYTFVFIQFVVCFRRLNW